LPLNKLHFKQKFFFVIVLLFSFCPLKAQNDFDCDTLLSQFDDFELRLTKINSTDPDLIPLHFFFINEIYTEIEQYGTGFLFTPEVIYQLKNCTTISYHDIVIQYNDLAYKAKNLLVKLTDLKEKVDYLFYLKAQEALLFNHTEQVYYYLERTLQFNQHQPDALLLLAKMLFQDEKYKECIEIIHVLYNEATILDRKHEMGISDFTILLYDKLYKTGDSLVKIEKSAEALEMFILLEQFCRNMPSNYCNDDYYHGIMRSKEGVYDSYITIAKVARERGNYDIERKFLEYAEQYKLENEQDLLHAPQ
ncbi:MAG: hypothetical protein RR356_04380, partial [Bacteroidales bacterium]